MKAKELSYKDFMIGDWVEFISKYGYGKGQIAGIEPREGDAEPTTFTIIKKDNEGETLLFVGVSRVCVRPIHLTAEILKKNGFDEHDIWQDEMGRIISIAWKECNGSNCYNYIDADVGRITIRDLPISYVHELQHLFRMLSIDKEIVID